MEILSVSIPENMGGEINNLFLCYCPNQYSRCDPETQHLNMMSSIQNTELRARLIQLESHFTWALNKSDADLTDLLNRLEEQLTLDLGRKEGAARTHSYMGFVKFLLGSNTEALSNLEKSVELNKSLGNDCDKLLVVPYGDLAWLHFHMGKFAECESYLDKLSDIEEKYPSAPYAEVLGEKGWTYLKFSRKYYERAEVCFKKALQLDPENGEWNTGLAILLSRTEDVLQDLKSSAAVDQLRRAIAINPDDDVLKVLLGLKLADHKKYSEAESLVEQALERSPEHPHVMRYVGKFLRNHGSVDKSTALLKRALNKGSNTYFIRHQLGLCYKKKIKHLIAAGSHHTKSSEIKQAREQCIYHLEMATELKPNFSHAMSELALQYAANHDLLRAEEMFTNSFQAAKEKTYDHQMVHLYYADFQRYNMRCEPAAIKHYIECLMINPSTYQGKKSAFCLETIARRRIKKDPKDGEAHGILGIIHKENGEKQEAVACFERALECGDSEEYFRYLCELKLSLQ